MSRRILPGKDLLGEGNRDVRFLILKETDPKDIDTLCYINAEMYSLCSNPDIIDEYLRYHNLDIKQKYSDESFYYNDKDILNRTIKPLITARSIILLKRIIQLINKLPSPYSYGPMNDIIKEILHSDNFTDEDIIYLFENFPFNKYNSIGYQASFEAADRKSPLLLKWIQDNNIVEYRGLLGGAIKTKDAVFISNILDNMPLELSNILPSYVSTSVDLYDYYGIIDIIYQSKFRDLVILDDILYIFKKYYPKNYNQVKLYIDRLKSSS